MSGTAVLLPNAKQQFIDANGVPLVHGTVDFYVPATTTRKDTWQDAAENTLNTNPITLDGSGQAIIFGNGAYRQVVKDVNGNLIWDQLTYGSPASNTYINVKVTFGATGDGVTDDTLAIQAALDYIVANGGKLYFPAGNYRITSALTATFTYTTAKATNRPSNIGDSAGQSQILWDGANTPTTFMLTLQRTGSSDAEGLHAHSVISNIGFAPISNAKIGYCNGLALIKWAYISAQNIWTYALNTGIRLEQVISSNFYDIKSRFNNFGLYSVGAPTSVLSNVYANNANTFVGCTFGANNQGGFKSDDGSFIMIGGSIEANGQNATPSNGYGARVTNTTYGSPVACVFEGVYFEGNGTTGNNGVNASTADIELICSNTLESNSFSIRDCTFIRLAANYAPYGVIIDKQSNTAATLSVTGCNFTDDGSYTPSSSRPYIYLQSDGGSMTNINLDVTGNYYKQSTEEPDFIQGTAYYAGNLPGFIRRKSFTALVYNSVGNQAILDNTVTALTWDTAVSNDATMWAIGNPTRLTVPAGVTRIRLAGNLRYEATNIAATYKYELFVYKNGTNFIGMPFQQSVVPTSNYIRAINFSSGIINVTGGDYFELMTLQNSGATIHTDSGSAGALDPTWFSMEIIE